MCELKEKVIMVFEVLATNAIVAALLWRNHWPMRHQHIQIGMGNYFNTMVMLRKWLQTKKAHFLLWFLLHHDRQQERIEQQDKNRANRPYFCTFKFGSLASRKVLRKVGIDINWHPLISDSTWQASRLNGVVLPPCRVGSSFCLLCVLFYFWCAFPFPFKSPVILFYRDCQRTHSSARRQRDSCWGMATSGMQGSQRRIFSSSSQLAREWELLRRGNEGFVNCERKRLHCLL